LLPFLEKETWSIELEIDRLLEEVSEFVLLLILEALLY
jgi:hypothetical protein